MHDLCKYFMNKKNYWGEFRDVLLDNSAENFIWITKQ